METEALTWADGVMRHWVILNELAQGLRPMAEGVAWFGGLDTEQQSAALRELEGYCTQARVSFEDGPEGIRLSGIKPTHTPAVLITRGRADLQLRKIVALPLDERVKAFRLMMALFSVADRRRRARQCTGGCSHFWHQLPDTADVTESAESGP